VFACVLALLVAGALIATVQARPGAARGGEQRALLQAQRAAARQERAAARREQRRASRPTPREPERVGKHRTPHSGPEREHAVVTSTCKLINWTWRKFANLPGNTVSEKISVAHYAPLFRTYTFDGETNLQNTQIRLPPGRRERLDTHSHWKTNGVRGHFDIVSKKECPPAPEVAIVKRQQIAGSGEGFTIAPLTGLIGQTVNYQITVQNTGNVPLVLSNFTDAKCDSGTISGGQGETPLQPGAIPSLGGTTTYICNHVLTSRNTYENAGTITATPPSGDGAPITKTSNIVVVNGIAPAPAFAIEKLQKIEGSSGSFTSSPLSGEVGQTVNYEIVVKNTGNTSLTFSNFTDEHCDSGTIAGGPSGALAPSESAAYTCKHVLTSADQTAGSVSNSATDTATPPGEAAITHTSNTVVVNLAAPPAEPKVYVGYADGAANNHGGSNGFPTPWNGSPNVTFIGCGFGGTDTCPKSSGVDTYDAGAIRIDAPSGGATLSVTGAKVVIGPCTYEPWPSLNVTLAPGHTLILTQTGKHQCTTNAEEQTNFDTSESFLKSPQYQQFLKTHKCESDGYLPAVTLTINGNTVTLTDSTQVLNTGGNDPDVCAGTTETQNWAALALPAGQHFARASRAAVVCRANRGRARARRRGHTAGPRCTSGMHVHASATVLVKVL
jgi:hypothetical protein